MLRRILLLAATAGAWLPALATAQPDPATSIVPASIRVLSPGPGSTDMSAVYLVTVFDVTGPPLGGVTVTLDFSGCPHVLPAEEQPYPDMTVDCGTSVLSAVTNDFGVASFLVMGSVVSRGAAGTGADCILVSAGAPPVVLGTCSPSAYDQDGVNGLTANDLSLWLCDFGAGSANVRSDFDANGTLGGADLSDWLSRYFEPPGSRTAPRCDGGPTTTASNPVADPQLRLAWNQCELDGGTQTRMFACTVNSGLSETLEGSFIAPAGIEQATGFEAEIEVIGDEGEDLASWWRLEPGGCRSTSLTLDVNYGDPIECPRMGLEGSWAGGVRAYPPIEGLPNRTRIRIIGSFFEPDLPLDAGLEYSLFRLRVNHQKTVGVGSCAGCSENVAILFRSLRITQSATAVGGCLSPARPAPGVDFLTGDFVIQPDITGDDSWIAFWQGVPAGWATVLDAPTAGSADAALQLACTNPVRGAADIRLTVPRATPASLALYDVAGRRRRVLLEGTLPAGPRQVRWDGRDDAGQPLASGYYALRLVTGDGAATRSVIVFH